jgi:hypothetical protein
MPDGDSVAHRRSRPLRRQFARPRACALARRFDDSSKPRSRPLPNLPKTRGILSRDPASSVTRQARPDRRARRPQPRHAPFHRQSPRNESPTTGWRPRLPPPRILNAAPACSGSSDGFARVLFRSPSPNARAHAHAAAAASHPSEWGRGSPPAPRGRATMRNSARIPRDPYATNSPAPRAPKP